ncbi:HTH-type transcriptional activator IlvY [Shewanella fidelis]|uniref:HTH-type transcriptional activator IlvY n=1 Tax=Shewanella fidelis TaxID=173509 RepID=A0AAW8NTK6_9GAMM|nr:HTH-type transcriptional activator IlvY [Shewanella fidelis]MDR8526186.1 HTH-type transcriptional activator IlvY [Shewanella fidelis]MDW4814045.1 HTH-type transcriptional activator IlvY [Shewanella fidelis]MDW4818240.1 HTH-type transcriptional activator IlvY [Shewanella fidelis]MDW4822358.1 HTH-type transcriptional activator IlvY [Shewanella fidelis]MDW4826472.1 HTH-type transcriptional activator IlvY [Shewanella fidelis]
MDIRTIKLYLHLADSLHFARTAQAMHVSPSTLSRAMQRLEDEVGVKLFQRDNRSVTLTNAGIEYRHFAELMLNEWGKLRTKVDPKQDVLRGRLNIFCSVTAAYSHLPALLDRFRREHPLVEIALTTGDAANAVNEVINNRADIAIAALPDPFPDSLYFTKIDDVPLSIIAPTFRCQVQELLTESYIPWDRLPFIVPEHGPGRKRVDNWFKSLGLIPNIYAQVSGQEAIASMVALGCGVSITPEVVINNSPVRDRIQLLTSPIEIPPFELGCCCKVKRQQEPVIDAFLKAI